MVTVKYKKNCGLCGQAVEIKGFSLVTEKDRLSFCCAGCQCIYELIYMNNQPMAIDTKTKNKSEEN